MREPTCLFVSFVTLPSMRNRGDTPRLIRSRRIERDSADVGGELFSEKALRRDDVVRVCQVVAQRDRADLP